jgi:hypothetical protein
MKKTALLGVLGIAALSLSLQAVVPQRWELRTREDFLMGKFDGVSVSNDGVLALAPKVDPIASPTEEFYLSILMTPEGTTYLGTGHGGKVYRIGKDGKAELYFQAPEMDVLCLAQDRRGTLYAATSPNGKIYKITEKSKSEVFFDPTEKYIWDLKFLDSGLLMVAVGEPGGIYLVSPQGEGRMIFKAEQNHILCLHKMEQGDILAGSGGNGLIYRITPQGQVSVVFETPYEEVLSLDTDREGHIYAAASGTPAKPRSEGAPSLSLQPEASVSVSISGASPASDPTAAPATAPAAGVLPMSVAVQKEPGAVYRITADGMATAIWKSDDEMVYSLIWKADEQKIVFGTGNKGRIYSVDKDGNVDLLLQENSEQVYQLFLYDAKTYILSNNPCSLGQLLTEQRFSGAYVSAVLDARILSAWGRISWEGKADAGATIQLQTRSGNTSEPNVTWSEWSPLYQKNDEQILSPKARFIQVRVLFKTQMGTVSPTLGKLVLFYLQTNVAPVISRLEFLKPNEVFLKLPDQEEVIMGVERHLPEPPAKSDDVRIVLPPKKAERKGFQTITWDASDANGDTLSYTISLRKEGETEWRVLQDEWKETIYSFDTTAFPDGTYFVKITASDSPSNPAGMELASEKVGPPLVIDNSLPVIQNFTAVRSGAVLNVSFQASDSYSYIDEVKYLVRPGDWRVVFPVDGICDSRSETFRFSIRLPAGAENLITVRVKDSYGNVGVYRQTF